MEPCNGSGVRCASASSNDFRGSSELFLIHKAVHADSFADALVLR